MPELKEVHEQLDHLRKEIDHWWAMQDETHTSVTRVHEHVCEHVELAMRLIVEILDEVENVLVVRKEQVATNRAKINEIAKAIGSGKVVEPLPELD